jgi:transcriptional regulator with XRE-family HTH domain
MDIKVRLIEILKKENYTFTQLAEYLDMSEEELTNALEQKTLELRSLELISKTLKIPLYSFFREEDDINKNTKPYYINKLWEGNKEI